MDERNTDEAIIKRIKKRVRPERMEKLSLNMKLMNVCTQDVIDYEKAEELLKQGAEPLGYVEEYGWPNNLYTAITDHIYDDVNTKEDYFKITELFLRYDMNIAKPAVPYDRDWVPNPITQFGGEKNDCMLRTLRLLLDHGLQAKDAGYGWGGEIDDFVNVGGSLSDKIAYREYRDYIHMLMLVASYPRILKKDTALQREIWYSYNQGRCDPQRFREWDWYDYTVDTSRCDGYPEVWHSVVMLIEKKTGEKIWDFGVSLLPEEVFGKKRWDGHPIDIEDKPTAKEEMKTGGYVMLKAADGMLVRIPLDKLSDWAEAQEKQQSQETKG